MHVLFVLFLALGSSAADSDRPRGRSRPVDPARLADLERPRHALPRPRHEPRPPVLGRAVDRLRSARPLGSVGGRAGARSLRSRARTLRFARDPDRLRGPVRSLRGRPDPESERAGHPGPGRGGSPEAKMRPDEDARRGRRGAGARALLVAREELRGRRDLLRAGQSGHRRGRRLPARLVGGNRRDRGVRREAANRPDGRRTRGPPLARDRGRIRQARASDLRSEPPRRPDRIFESLRQGVLRAARDSDRRGRRLQLRGRSACGDRPFRISGRFEGGRPGRRKGRLDARLAGRRRKGARTHLRRAGLRRRGGPRPDRGVPDRPRSLFSRHLRRRIRDPSADRARLQEGVRRRPRAEYRRDGRALARRRSRRRGLFERPPRDHLAHAPRARGGGPAVPGSPLRRAHGHGSGTEGPGVQRPVRRPRDRGDPAAHRLRHGRGPPARLPRKASSKSFRRWRSRRRSAPEWCSARRATPASPRAAR